jgi:RNA polymerase sigma-70 factor (ECF subfamily)
VEPTHLDDLSLAQACARGEHEAIATFEERYLSQTERYLSHLRIDPDIKADLRGELRDRLLAPPLGRGGKLALYGGFGPLDRWVQVAAIRLALNVIHDRHPNEWQAPTSAPPDPERDAFQHRYGDMLRGAIEQALRALPARDRSLLRLYFLESMRMEDIAVIYRVDRTTVSRWLTQAKEDIHRVCKTLVRTDLDLSSSGFDSLVHLLLSQLDIDEQALAP